MEMVQLRATHKHSQGYRKGLTDLNDQEMNDALTDAFSKKDEEAQKEIESQSAEVIKNQKIDDENDTTSLVTEYKKIQEAAREEEAKKNLAQHAFDLELLKKKAIEDAKNKKINDER